MDFKITRALVSVAATVAIIVSLIWLIVPHLYVKKPTDQAFTFISRQLGDEQTVYNTSALVSFHRNECTVAIYEVDTIDFEIRRTKFDYLELVDEEGHKFYMEFFRDRDKVVVGARLSGDFIVNFYK